MVLAERDEEGHWTLPDQLLPRHESWRSLVWGVVWWGGGRVGGGRVGVCKVRGCEGVWEVVRGRVGV